MARRFPHPRIFEHAGIKPEIIFFIVYVRLPPRLLNIIKKFDAIGAEVKYSSQTAIYLRTLVHEPSALSQGDDLLCYFSVLFCHRCELI